MNAIERNPFTEKWRSISEAIFQAVERPRAVVCISAHWLTRGTKITATAQQKTIHDFGGFPPALYSVEYPAPGSPEIARELQAALADTVNAELTDTWGLDHGCWSILCHMNSAGDVPVLQVSIDASASVETYFKIGEKLRPLRKQGILFIGSGNIVHNLRLVDWQRLNERGYAHTWATEADTLVQRLIGEKQDAKLIHWHLLGESMQLAVNSAEHFVPLLYVLGLRAEGEQPEFFNVEAVGGALTMTSVRFG